LDLLKYAADSINSLRLLSYRAELGEERAVIEELLTDLRKYSGLELLMMLMHLEEIFSAKVMQSLPSHPVIYDYDYLNETVTKQVKLVEDIEQKFDKTIQQLLASSSDEDYVMLFMTFDIDEIVSELSNSSIDVLPFLLSLLNDESTYVSSMTAQVLSKLSKTTDWAEPAIVQWIEQHQDEEYVGAGIDALWEIVEGEG